MWAQLLQGLMGGGAGGGFGMGGMGGGGAGQNPSFQGQDAANNAQAMGQQVANQAEFSTAGTPPSLQNQLQAEQMANQTPQPQFGQFYSPGFQPGVLPPLEQPQVQPFLPQGTQQVPVSAGAQMPQAQPFQSATPNQGGGGPGTVGHGLFNMIGYAPSSPQSEQGFDPNIFLRLSEGYNRGGALGALGMALTRFQ